MKLVHSGEFSTGRLAPPPRALGGGRATELLHCGGLQPSAVTTFSNSVTHQLLLKLSSETCLVIKGHDRFKTQAFSSKSSLMCCLFTSPHM